MIIIPLVANLLWLLALGGIVVLIVRAVGRRRGFDRQATGVTMRRFFQYSLMLALLGVVAVGLAGLIQQILPTDGPLVRDDTAALARSIAFLVVGGPALAALAVWNARLHAADPAERHSLGFAFYLTGALAGSLIIGGFAAFRTIRWVLAESGFDDTALAAALVAAVVWAVHWLIAARFGSAPRMEPNLVIGSAAGLVGTATAVGFGLAVALGEIYDAAYGTIVTESLADGLRVAVAGALVAVPVWWWHWRRRGRTVLWHAYVLLFGVLGALLTTMVAAGTMLFLLLEWFVGDPDTASRAAWFDPLPGALAAIAVGSVGWWYHRLALAAGPAAARTEVDRVYEYLVAAVGLIATFTGSVALLAALVEAITPGGRTIATGSGADVLVFSLTMLGVGLPLWSAYWSRVGRHVRIDEMVERASPTRRAYVLLLAGLGGVILPFAALAIVIVGLEGLLEGTFGWETVRDMRVGIALTLVSAAGAGYHVAVLRSDRAVLPAEARPVVRDVVLVSGDGAGLAAALSEQVGARVRVWHRLDVAAEREPPVEAVVEAVRAETHEHVMVLTGPAGAFEVVPFDDR